MAEVARDKDEGACTVVEGGGRKSLLSDPGSELHLGRGKGKRKGAKTKHGMCKTNPKGSTLASISADRFSAANT